MSETYTINQCCEDVASVLRVDDARDLPKIRTPINDTLDAMSKDGRRVNFNFNQDRAVKRVQNSNQAMNTPTCHGFKCHSLPTAELRTYRGPGRWDETQTLCRDCYEALHPHASGAVPFDELPKAQPQEKDNV